MRHAQGRAGECQRWLQPPSKTESENCSERSTGRPRPTPHGDGRMPAVKDVGEPCAGEPHARFEVAAGGNRNQSAIAARNWAPPADPTRTPAPRAHQPMTPRSVSLSI